MIKQRLNKGDHRSAVGHCQSKPRCDNHWSMKGKFQRVSDNLLIGLRSLSARRFMPDTAIFCNTWARLRVSSRTNFDDAAQPDPPLLEWTCGHEACPNRPHNANYGLCRYSLGIRCLGRATMGPTNLIELSSPFKNERCRNADRHASGTMPMIPGNSMMVQHQENKSVEGEATLAVSRR
ncbi:hypothetical protein DIPPA_53967 [Diplonema papillatum]|nr:hypothetical protein DIPPA_50045 [Diplonema papillatum]KAJ9442022.1 hypothetical protein DIPPA_53967 [Diplonema papillatum]